jgi:hypothetical protein
MRFTCTFAITIYRFNTDSPKNENIRKDNTPEEKEIRKESAEKQEKREDRARILVPSPSGLPPALLID